MLAWLVRGNAHEGRTVLPSPGGVQRHLAIGDEALVRVDRRVCDEGELGRIAQDARHVALPHRGQVGAVLGLGSPEQVVALVVEERLVEEHARPGAVAQGLGHERGHHAVLERLLANDQA